MRILILSLLLISIISCTTDKTSTEPPPPTFHIISYDVGGTCLRATIVYSNDTGDATLISHVRTPWGTSYGKETGYIGGLCAFGEDTGTVIISISIDGDLTHHSSVDAPGIDICISDTI